MSCCGHCKSVCSTRQFKFLCVDVRSVHRSNQLLEVLIKANSNGFPFPFPYTTYSNATYTTETFHACADLQHQDRMAKSDIESHLYGTPHSLRYRHHILTPEGRKFLRNQRLIALPFSWLLDWKVCQIITLLVTKNVHTCRPRSHARLISVFVKPASK